MNRAQRGDLRVRRFGEVRRPAPNGPGRNNYPRADAARLTRFCQRLRFHSCIFVRFVVSPFLDFRPRIRTDLHESKSHTMWLDSRFSSLKWRLCQAEFLRTRAYFTFEEETFGQVFRRGQETCAERRTQNLPLSSFVLIRAIRGPRLLLRNFLINPGVQRRVTRRIRAAA